MELSSHDLFGDRCPLFKLYPHQASACQWARIVEYNIGDPRFLKGGILADDMGLGKTKTMVALIAANPVPNTLITTPPSTRYAWIRECLTLLTGFRVYTVEGDSYAQCYFKRTQEGDLEIDTRNLSAKKKEKMLEPYVLICNYQLISAGKKNDKLITDLTYWRMIIDEGHFLKNDDIDTWKKICAIKHPVQQYSGGENRLGSRWIVTGTPIQMDIRDIINIFRCVDSRFLTSRTERELMPQLQSLIYTNLFRRNRYQLTPYMKRLMRYPDKDPVVYNELMDLEETQLSREVEKMPYEYIVQRSQDFGFVSSVLVDERAFCIVLAAEYKFKNQLQKSGTLTIAGYDQFGNAVYTQSQGRTPSSAFVESEQFRNTFSFPFGYIPDCFSQTHPNAKLKYTGKMSKIERFRDIVAQNPGQSFVIFYHYKSIMRKLEEYCQTVFPGYMLFKINGDVTSDKERDDIIQKTSRLISQGQPCFLLSSIMATAEGMNYQHFSNMFSFDPEYNQKTEDQADSRINRIGQVNDVRIWRLAVNDFNTAYGKVSIDRRIQDLRDERSHLSDIIDQYNAAWSFRRYYYTNPEGQRECGIIFNPHFEAQPQGSVNGPNSVGPTWIR